MQSITKLEENAVRYPNSIDANQALADAYAREGRLEEAIEAYQDVIALYPAIAALNVNRIRLGAIALGISSLLFLMSTILRTPMIMVDTPVGVAEYMASSTLAISNILFLPILIFLSCAAISVYKLLSTSNNNLLAFWAMVSIIIGAGLFLPLFSINAVVMPAVAELYLRGDISALGISALSIYDVALRQPLALVFTFGGYLLFVGLTLFHFVVWNSGYLPKWASLLFWVGWLLFFVVNQGYVYIFTEEIYWIFNPILIALLIAIGGVGLAHGMWQQAALRLGPAIEFTQKVES